MASITPTIQFLIGGDLETCAGEPLATCADVLLEGAGTWDDVTADVRLSPAWSWTQGLLGSGPQDRVALPGMLTFFMDNSENNSAGLAGYYSPSHANARRDFELGLPVRLKLTSGTTTLYPFYGRIKKIAPAFGVLRERNTEVVVGDFMEQAATKKVDLIPVQLSKRNDQLITTILANMPIAPLNTSLSTGPDTFTSALNSDTDESTFVNTVLQKCAQSGLDYVFIKGNGTDGETLVYQSRQDRSLSGSAGASQATLNDTMDELSLQRASSLIWNNIKITAFPDRVDASVAVLFSISAEMTLSAGATQTITARFRDPSGLSNRTSVYPGSETTPVATTDYKMSSIAGNGGSDLNANLSVSVTWGGNTAEITLTNTGGATGYVNHLQLRGKGIYHYDPLVITKENVSSQQTHGERTLNFSLPFQSSANVATDFAEVLVSRYASAFNSVSRVGFVANKSDALMAAALACTIGTRVTIVESQTGLSGDYFINGVTGTVKPGNVLHISWVLEPASADTTWMLDDAVLSVLGTSTYLGF